MFLHWRPSNFCPGGQRATRGRGPMNVPGVARCGGTEAVVVSGGAAGGGANVSSGGAGGSAAGGGVGGTGTSGFFLPQMR